MRSTVTVTTLFCRETAEKVLQLSLLATRRCYRNCGVGRYIVELLKTPALCGPYEVFLAHVEHAAVNFFTNCGLSDDTLLNEKFRKKKALLAYQQQAVCVMRLVQEVNTLREQLSQQMREVKSLKIELELEKKRRNRADEQDYMEADDSWVESGQRVVLPPGGRVEGIEDLLTVAAVIARGVQHPTHHEGVGHRLLEETRAPGTGDVERVAVQEAEHHVAMALLCGIDDPQARLIGREVDVGPVAAAIVAVGELVAEAGAGQQAANGGLRLQVIPAHLCRIMALVEEGLVVQQAARALDGISDSM
ncbi:hypothetical protein JZ751_021038 [Albula glossodonta]|uniref:Uncharacterized protein n=1 Tax=Albula glossodonta TaxID=121402 RepID=A0A8T2PJA4_9TELE|nr:hypothetical protein JZ751_021038 [Albula glossodonta]